jgi:hypothetical protein
MLMDILHYCLYAEVKQVNQQDIVKVLSDPETRTDPFMRRAKKAGGMSFRKVSPCQRKG